MHQLSYRELVVLCIITKIETIHIVKYFTRLIRTIDLNPYFFIIIGAHNRKSAVHPKVIIALPKHNK